MSIAHRNIDDIKEDLEKKIEDSSAEIMRYFGTQITTLRDSLVKHTDYDDKRFETLSIRFDKYVSLKLFMWLFGMSMTIVVALSATIFQETRIGRVEAQQRFDIADNKIELTNNNLQQIKAEISYLRGQWDLQD